MPHAEERWHRLIEGLRLGDRQVLQEFCDYYGPMLERLADRHLPNVVRRRVGPEDVVQSVCRTFLRRARAGEFELPDSEALWRLLCAITLTKVRDQARYHGRTKRGVGREVSLSSATAEGAAPGFDPVDPRPSPAEAAAFTDQFELLISGLDDEERWLVDLKLQDCTNLEAAARMGCSERTVYRLLRRLQARLEVAFQAS
jgi:RNA polymerase sigma factor (sigma-70 family)